MYVVIVLRHKLGNTYEHPFVDIYFFYVPLHRVIFLYASPCVYVGTQYCQLVISMSLESVGLIVLLLYIVVFLFYMLMVLRYTGSRFKYFLYVLFMLIYFAGTARRVILSEYTYIYCTCAGCIIVIV